MKNFTLAALAAFAMTAPFAASSAFAGDNTKTPACCCKKCECKECKCAETCGADGVCSCEACGCCKK